MTPTARTAAELRRCTLETQGVAGSLEANMDALYDTLMENMPGQPKAQAFGPRGSTAVPWCWAHEREIRECHEADEDCTGEPITITDRVGEHAVQPSAAASDLAMLRKHITAAYTALAAADAIRAKWLAGPPPKAKTKDDDGPGDMWCRSCWQDNQHCEPISEHTPLKGLCRWCADFHREHHQDPPPELLAYRHEGRRITTADIAKHVKPKGKKKTRR